VSMTVVADLEWTAVLRMISSAVLLASLELPDEAQCRVTHCFEFMGLDGALAGP
jgi:hypothetical protein